MEPFFYLHSELEVETDSSVRTPVDFDENVSTTCRGNASTTLSIYGKDVSGGSVVVRVRQYRITFYVSFRDERLCEYCCRWIVQNDRGRYVVSMKSVTGFQSMMLDKSHQVADEHNYANSALTNVIRMQVRKRQHVVSVIETIDQSVYDFYVKNNACGEYLSAVKYYESNIDCITLATRTLGLDACQWCFLYTDKCIKLKNHQFVGREYCFFDNGAQDPKVIFTTTPPIPDHSPQLPKLPPLVKIMSFDIECLSSDVEKMPDAETDPIIQISTVYSADALGRSVYRNSDEKKSQSPVHVFHRYLFTLGDTCSAIDGVSVRTFVDERDMLKAFVEHVHAEDPDIVTGYNINNFDFPYLFQRIAKNNADSRLGRGRKTATCKKPVREIVSQYASFLPKTHDTYIPGRVGFDMYTHLRKEVELRSYTLNSVSSHFLNKNKDDVSYREIPTLYNGDGDSRARLGHYCVKDSQLVLELAFKQQTFVHAFERCKVFRTILQYLVDRGQQIKMYSMLLAWCSERRILVNDVTSCRHLELNRKASAEYEADMCNSGGNTRGWGHKRKRQLPTNDELQQDEDGHDEESRQVEERSVTAIDNGASSRIKSGSSTKRGYDGAIVLDPIAGIYHTPVVCLDYASLYPSIMIGFNLCFTTLVLNKEHGRKLCELGEAEESPVGEFFLKTTMKKGVLPSILEMLMNERAEVRKCMKHLTANSFEHTLLDVQQHTLKIAANSIYGAIGCEKSILNFVQIPSSVTAYGRRLIVQTKRHVESSFEGSKVVYGDTDSVMVNLIEWNSHIWECAAIGQRMADSVTELINRKPIRLQFETVYKPFLLCTKKRYAAGVYNDLEKMAALDADEAAKLCLPKIKYKGLQVVRRDNCTFSTRLMRFTLETLMDANGAEAQLIERITTRLRDELRLLFDGCVNMKELVISKEWKKRTANGQIHDRLAQRMQQRDHNSAPSIGDRVPYVVIADSKNTKLSDRGEDPLYVIENGLQVDLLYYADNQVANPIAQLLKVVLRDKKTLEDIKDLFWPDNAPRRLTDKRRNVGDIVWTRKAAIGSRRVTDFFTSTTTESLRGNKPTTLDELTNAIGDVEDLLDGLADKCMICKSNDAAAVKSCRDRECETLYDRFSKLRTRNDMRRRLDVFRGQGNSGQLVKQEYDVEHDKSQTRGRRLVSSVGSRWFHVF